MSDRPIEQLTKLAADFRRAEVQVVRAFFIKPRRAKEHVRWLKAQGFKEYSAIKPIVAALAALHPNIDRGIDRHDYTELTEKLADETKHARLVMDLLQEISGKKITPRDLTWLPQDRKRRLKPNDSLISTLLRSAFQSLAAACSVTPCMNGFASNCSRIRQQSSLPATVLTLSRGQDMCAAGSSIG